MIKTIVLFFIRLNCSKQLRECSKFIWIAYTLYSSIVPRIVNKSKQSTVVYTRRVSVVSLQYELIRWNRAVLHLIPILIKHKSTLSSLLKYRHFSGFRFVHPELH